MGKILFSIYGIFAYLIYIFLSVKYLEEKDLRRTVGKKYEDYQAKVPMIIPFTKKVK